MNSKRKLCIAVDARPLAFPGTGNATYLHRMLGALQALRPEDDWILYSHRGLDPGFADVLQRPGVELVIDPGAVQAGPLWMHLRLPKLLRASDADLFWATLAMLPLRYRSRIRDAVPRKLPSIVNFHDLNAYRAPETMVAWNRWQHRLLDRRSLEECDRAACLSQTTKDDILAQFPELSDEKLVVVYPGAEFGKAGLTPEAPAGSVGALEAFHLCVGTLEPRKNQAVLIEAYRAARRERPELPPLVLAGRKGWGDASLFEELQGGALESEGVYHLGDASDAGLLWLYERARALCLPSLHEGFGLPIIEAYRFGVPAILSDIPIFREIGGGQALFAPPGDAEAWKTRLLELDDRYAAGDPPRPEFDAEAWSWLERARPLSEAFEACVKESDLNPA